MTRPDHPAAAGMTEQRRDVTDDAGYAYSVEPNGDKLARVYWIALPWIEEMIDVRVRGRRILVDRKTLDRMAESIIEAEISDPEDDAGYAHFIRGMADVGDGWYDVTDLGGDMLQDGLTELGIESDRAK